MEPITSSSTLFDQQTLTDIRNKLSGHLLLPNDEGYEEARKVWNGMIDRRPALIIQCKTTNDVIEAVNFGRKHQLLIAIKGGGHNVTGNASCDGGLMIDLSLMKNVRVDPESRLAHAQGGATWKDFDTSTQQHGLASTGGIISSTGIAGLTLGGGVGWLVRRFGFSCDNLIGAEVVIADGQLVVVNEKDNAELFWGLRGGGGNFGIVTNFSYRLYPVSTVLGGMILHSRDAAKDVLEYYREFMKTAPLELTLYAAIIHTPDGLPVIAFIGCYSADVENGKEVLEPLRKFGAPLADAMEVKTYGQMQTMLDEAFPHGDRYYWKSGFLEELSDAAIDTIIEHAVQVPSKGSAIILEYYGGAGAKEPEGGTAYPHRQAQYDLVIISHWSDKDDDDKNMSWAREFWTAMQPHSSHRVYVNTLGVEGEERVREAYGENYDRLLALKKQFDPENLFRLNQNINPKR